MAKALNRFGLMGFRGGTYPNVGGSVAEQLGRPGVAERYGLEPEPLFVVRKDGIFGPDGETPSRFGSLADIKPGEFPDVTFIACHQQTMAR